MSNTNPITTIMVDFGDTVQEVTENNYKELLVGLNAMIGGCYNGNEIIDEAMTDLIEKFYEVEKNSEAWKRLNENYEELMTEQTENLVTIRKCEATIELIEKFVEVMDWE